MINRRDIMKLGLGYGFFHMINRNGTTNILEAIFNNHGYATPASYIISKDDNNVFAQNGLTGINDFVGNSATAVIKSAIDKIKSTGGKIHLKEGEYEITDGLLLSSMDTSKGYIFEGIGENSIIKNMSTDPAITLQARYSIIRDLQIIGNSSSGDGLLISSTGDGTGGATNNELLNIVLTNNDVGIKIEGATYNTLISNCRAYYNRKYGIQLINGLMEGSTNLKLYEPNKTTLLNTSIISNYEDGIRIDAGNTTTMLGCEVEENNGYGIYINTPGNIILGLYSEVNSKAGICIPRGIKNNIVISNSIFDKIPIILEDPDNTIFINRDFSLGGNLSRIYLLNMESKQSTLIGSSSGTILWSMPFQGGSYKRFLCYLSDYRNETENYQEIIFPVPFIQVPAIVVDDSKGSTVSTTKISFPINMKSSVTGWIIIEGY